MDWEMIALEKVLREMICDDTFNRHDWKSKFV